MKLSKGILVSFACAALAQTDQQLDPTAQAALEQLQKALPSCAVSCLAQTVPASGCALTDTQCICTNQKLAQLSEACLGANCTVIESLQTKRFQDKTCGIPVRNRQAKTLRTNWALWTFSTLVVVARFATRSPSLGGVGYGADDYMSIVTQAFVTVVAVTAHFQTHYGMGKDIWQLEPWQITSVLKWFYVGQIVYSFAVGMMKASMVLLYLRIFPDTVSHTFRRVCFVVLFLLFCQLSGFSISAAFQCDPVSYAWTQWDGQHEGKCINLLHQIYAGSATNITMDLIVFVLPIPRLLKIQVSTRMKIGICLTFLTGLFVTLCSMVRLYYVVHWRTATNPTWTNNPVSLWSFIEVDIGAICACMPALSGPIKKIWTAMIADPVSHLYASHKKRSERGDSGRSQSKVTDSTAGWRSISSEGGVKPGVDTIMRNVSLNVSDEVELVGRVNDSQGGDEESQAAQPSGFHTHEYRGQW